MKEEPSGNRHLDPNEMLAAFREGVDKSASTAALCADYEEGLLSAVVESVLAVLHGFPEPINASDPHAREGFPIRTSVGQAYLAVQPARWENNALVIVIREPRGGKAASYSEDVEGPWGRFSKVRVECSPAFVSFGEEIANHVAQLCTAFYAWLWIDIQEHFDRDHEELARTLYSIVRRSLCMNLPVASRVYLYAAFAMGDRYVSKYIPDAPLREKMLNQLVSARGQFMHAPIEVFAAFTDRLLDYDKTFTKQAVDRLASDGDPASDLVRGEFSKAAYATDPISLAEGIVYDAAGNVVQALVEQKHIILAAGYPRELEGIIAPALRKCRPELHSAVENCNRRYLNRIKKLLAIDNQSSVGSFLGDFSGSFFVQVWKHLEKKGSLPPGA